MRLMIRFIPLVCEKQNWRLRWFCRWQIWNLVWSRQFWAQLKVSVTSDCSYLLMRSTELNVNCWNIRVSHFSKLYRPYCVEFRGLSGLPACLSQSQRHFWPTNLIKKNSQYNSIFWISLFRLAINLSDIT